VELEATTKKAADREAEDIAAVSISNLQTLLNVIDGHQPPDGATIRSVIEAVMSDLVANQ